MKYNFIRTISKLYAQNESSLGLQVFHRDMIVGRPKPHWKLTYSFK